MEIVILFAILALLVFDPRRGGRMPGQVAVLVGALLLIWLPFASGPGWLWEGLMRR